MAKSQIKLFRLFGDAFKTWSKTFRLVWQLFWKEPAQAKVKYSSWHEEFSSNRITIFTSVTAFAGALVLHLILPPEVEKIPLAIFGCSLLALVVNRRWGTMAVILYCVMVLVVKIHFHIRPYEMSVLLWNSVMRFLFLEMFVVLFDFLRRQIRNAPAPDAKGN
jgi:hypothetical protein